VDETAKALAVAADTKSWFIDLNKASTNYVNSIGQQVRFLSGFPRYHLQ